MSRARLAFAHLDRTWPLAKPLQLWSRGMPVPALVLLRLYRVAGDARNPLVDDLAGVEPSVRVDALEELALDEHTGGRDVLVEPGAVLLADAVVMGDRAAVVHERLLDRALHEVVRLHVVLAGVVDREREVLARAGVVAVRQVAHDEALH